MTGNTALDIFIGLVFVYLLYSLFATVILEFISTNLSIRAKNLRRVIYNMLNDDRKDANFWRRIWWFIASIVGKGFSQESGGLAKAFFDSPGIRYLGGNSWVKSSPSNISSKQFANSLVQVMAGDTKNQNHQAEAVRKYLDAPPTTAPAPPLGTEASQEAISNGNKPSEDSPLSPKLASESGIAYLKFLFNDAHGDMDKFKQRVEEWYEEMMPVATEWYKKRMQIWLFAIGLILASFFNLNTLYITKILALNNEARQQMVQLASSYMENRDSLPDMNNMDEKELAQYHKEIKKQAEQAADVLSLPKEFPRYLKVSKNLNRQEFLKGKEKDTIISFAEHGDNYIVFNQPEELPYLNVGEYALICRATDYQPGSIVCFNHVKFLWGYRFWGYIITAIAISLGAPFWFDLLNKLMQLRGSVSQKNPKALQPKSNNEPIEG